MLEVLDLFREKGTLDELGIGSIRDTFADRFFPAISTIQTRARYFLFVPWIYQALERDRISSARAAAHARHQQARLVESLKAGGEGPASGVIGIDAGPNLQRPPSLVYWSGLRRLGILEFAGSTEGYHAALDGFYARSRRPLRSDVDELVERAPHHWHPSLPAAPEDLLSSTTLALRREDADFLAEHIRHHVGDSLLGRCLTSQIGRVRTAKAIWELSGLENLDRVLRQDIEDARRFALLMEGAVLTYNLMLAEAAEAAGIVAADSLVPTFRGELAPWSEEMKGDRAALRSWDRQAMWTRLRLLNPRLPLGAQHFAEQWISAATLAPDSVMDDEGIRRIIALRERHLKHGLARLSNPRALERWSGRSGSGRLSYRWLPVARQILMDILDGQGRQPGEA